MPAVRFQNLRMRFKVKTIVLLSAYGSPISTAYLNVLLEHRDIRLFCVYEQNEKLEGEMKRIYRERFQDRAPVFKRASDFGVEECTIPGANTPEGCRVLRQIRPDLMVLAGAGIVNEGVLDIPKWGTLNCHPGLLPRYRGCTCVEWAIFENQPVGATCHFVTTEIDAGDIVLAEPMSVSPGQTYVDLRLDMFYFQAQLLGRAVRKLLTAETPDKADLTAFNWSEARYYKPIPEEALQEVHRKLLAHEYCCGPEKK